MPDNPYARFMVIEATLIVDAQKYKIDRNGIKQTDKFKIEKIPATKVFHTPGVKKKVCELSDKAIRLYAYIINDLTPQKDYIEINPSYYMTLNNIKSKGTYYKALSDLLKADFIKNCEFENVYWLNPEIFYCGNRLEKYPDSVVVTSTINRR